VIRDSFDLAGLEETYAWPASGRHIRLNMAIDNQGRYADAQGKSTGLSSIMDRKILKIIRSGADAIVVGASTVRAEGWNLPAAGLLVVLSTSGDLPWDNCPDRSRVHVLAGDQTTTGIVELLTDMNIDLILVEGGRSVARQFAFQQLFDDVCLTIGANTVAAAEKAAASALSQLLDVSADSYDLVSLRRDEGTPSVFTLWRRAPGMLDGDSH
jgi:riboflavin biosynthesis pyrimidine reductase